MKRDMSLIREILFEIEATADPYIQFGGLKAKHVVLLADAGLVVVALETRTDMHGVVAAKVERLTWRGHELLDVIRSDTLWAKAKEVLIEPTGGVALDLLIAWGKAQMAAKFGLDL